MNKNSVVSLQDPEPIADPLIELLRTEAYTLIKQAIKAEFLVLFTH